MTIVEIRVEKNNGNLTFDELFSAVRNTVRSVDATENILFPISQSRGTWTVKDLHHSTPTLELEKEDAESQMAAATARLIDRFNAWEMGDAGTQQILKELHPSEFSRYRALTRLTTQDIKMHISSDHRQTIVTGKSFSVLEAHVQRQWKETTTIDGYLDQVNVHQKLEAGIYESGSGRRIPCYFNEEMLADVVQNIKRRVVAFGEVSYQLGLIDRLRLLKLRPVESAEVDIKALRGIGKQLTPGQSSEEFIRNLWGGEENE